MAIIGVVVAFVYHFSWWSPFIIVCTLIMLMFVLLFCCGTKPISLIGKTSQIKSERSKF